MCNTIEQKNPNQFVTSGPLLKSILKLAVPVALGMFMEVALSVTDFFWVGKLGSSAQDSITTSMVIIWSVFSVISIITVGTTALVSRYIGANQLSRAIHYFQQATWLSLIFALGIAVLGNLLTPSFLKLMKAGTETQKHALPYMHIFFSTAFILLLVENAYSVFRASGDTKTPTRVAITVVLINLIFDPILIFGWGPIPPLGVPGAAIASAIALTYGLLRIYRLILKGKLGYSVGRLFGEKINFFSLTKIIKIGLPIGTQQLFFVLVYWFLIGYVHEFGVVAGAAMGIGNRMESFSYLTCYGLSMAASTMVGQNLGAGKPRRAAKAAWGATGLGIALTMIFSVALIGFPKFISSVFTSNPEVSKIAVDYLIILGLSQFTMAVEIILEGAFSGSGDTLPPMIVMIPGSLLRIPLAYYLAFELNWGINGIWWTLTITTTLKAIVLAYWFKLGHWKLKSV